jgi:hypothetical protein
MKAVKRRKREKQIKRDTQKESGNMKEMREGRDKNSVN